MSFKYLDANGNIPAGKRCPVAEAKKCTGYRDGWCSHKGLAHTVPFSCAIARGWDLIQRLKKKEV